MNPLKLDGPHFTKPQPKNKRFLQKAKTNFLRKNFEKNEETSTNDNNDGIIVP